MLRTETDESSLASSSAVRQPILPDVVAVSFEQHPGAAMIADLLRRSLDHAVAFARHGRLHLGGPGNLEALLCARLGLDLGHLALLFGIRPRQSSGSAGCAPTSVLMSVFAATAAL